jgi:hypothetical protein
VHVKRAGDGSRADRIGNDAGRRYETGRLGYDEPKKNGGHEGRRQFRRLAHH